MTSKPERAIARLVAVERDRALLKHGSQLTVPTGTGPTADVLGLFGEIYHDDATSLADRARLATDNAFAGLEDRPGTWADILLEEVFEALAESDPPALLAELVQVAATAERFARALVAIHPDLELALPSEPRRLFTPAHLGLVYLLAEQQGATHVRLRRLWDAKATRPRDPWPWISDSGIRTRCSELVAWGLVEDTGARGESATGRPATIWSLVGVDPRALGRDVEAVPGVVDGVPERLAQLLAEAGDDVTVRAQLQLAAELAGALS